MSGMKSASSTAASVNWPAPPMPAGYPWPAPPHMNAMPPPMGIRPPMGVRPPMMFGPPPAGFPPGSFQQPPRLPFIPPQDKAGDESQATGADEEIGKPEGSGGGGDSAEESLHRDSDDTAGVAHMGNFPRPMGGGDWRMRGPVPPFMRGPNMPRPDMMRGPRPLLGESPRPIALLGAPPRFRLQNFPNLEEEEGEEYCDEYGEEEGNEEEYADEDYNEEEYNEEEYDEESGEFPVEGNYRFI